MRHATKCSQKHGGMDLGSGSQSTLHFLADRKERIIGFRLVDRHTSEVIAESIIEVLTEYGLLDRTISITLDNASVNANAMTSLKDPLKAYNSGFKPHILDVDMHIRWNSKYLMLKRASSMAGRIVEERRAKLTPQIVEMLILIKDWELQDDQIESLGLGPLEEYFLEDDDEEDAPPAFSSLAQ